MNFLIIGMSATTIAAFIILYLQIRDQN